MGHRWREESTERGHRWREASVNGVADDVLLHGVRWLGRRQGEVVTGGGRGGESRGESRSHSDASIGMGWGFG
jgi:hypothetical protein